VQTYYFQLGEDIVSDSDLLSNAIKFSEEAVYLNPKLSQGFYHLAKYYSLKNDTGRLLQNLEVAIELDRDYSWKYEQDGVFKKNQRQILEFLAQLKVSKKIVVLPKLQKAKSIINNLEQKNISQSKALFEEFKCLKEMVQLAEKDFQTNTFFGYDDCERKLNII